MSAAETIGVDLGGTKMQVGVLDGTETLWESRETSPGQSQDELVELLVREVSEAREARPEVVAVGLGIPATIDHERGVAVAAVNLPLPNCRSATSSPSASACRSSSTTTPTSPPSPSTSTAPPGASRTW